MALCAGFVAVGTRRILGDELCRITAIVCVACHCDRSGIDLPVVPTIDGDGIGLPVPLAAPAVDAVVFHDGAGLAEGDV